MQGPKQKQRKYSKKRKQRPPDQLGGGGEPLRYNDSGVGPTFFDEVPEVIHPLDAHACCTNVQSGTQSSCACCWVRTTQDTHHKRHHDCLSACLCMLQLGLRPAAADAPEGDMMAKYAAALDWDDGDPD